MKHTRNYSVTQVPRRDQPPNPPPPGGDAYTFLSLLWGLVDRFGFIIVIVVGVLIHVYLQQLLQLSPQAPS